jgi:hypothetical protein
MSDGIPGGDMLEKGTDGGQVGNDQFISRDALLKRIHNLEVALIALHAIIQDTLPPAYADSANAVINDLFNHSEPLGAFRNANFMGE